MGLGPSLAILIIAVFLVFVFWGRSAGGRAVLVRVFGEPPSRRKPRRTASQSRATTKSSKTTKTTKTATKRGTRK